MHHLASTIRSFTPLWLRKLVGPWIGYTVYVLRIHIRGRTWEPTVLSIHDTLRKVQRERLSVIRFGDGEISLIEGADLAFQQYDPALAQQLREIIQTHHEKLLICIPGIFGDISSLATTSFWFEIHHLFRHGSTWKQLVSSDYQYGDAFLARPYIGYKDKGSAAETFQLVKKLWAQEKVVLIEGSESRLGVGNDLFAGVHSLRRILCPPEHAYRKVAEITERAATVPKDTLILISLGPAAKVVAFELFRKGYRVIDIGHIDMEYEMFLRNEVSLTAVPHKYFNELGTRHPEVCTDPAYLGQIIARIE